MCDMVTSVNQTVTNVKADNVGRHHRGNRKCNKQYVKSRLLIVYQHITCVEVTHVVPRIIDTSISKLHCDFQSVPCVKEHIHVCLY